MAKYIKITLPINKPNDTVKLCGRVQEEHTALGVDSPLPGFVNMTDFDNKLTQVIDLRKDGDKRDENSQKLFGEAKMKCGVAKGQTRDVKNTLKWFVNKSKKILLGLNDGNEDALEEYGFTVVITTTGARKNVKIPIPRTPADLLELAQDILEQHDALGGGSPLIPDLIDMAAFQTLADEVDTAIHDSEVASDESQSYHNQALNILGYAEGQTSTTAGTLYHMLILIRNRLLEVHQGNEEAISEYGFKVVISSKQPGRKKGAAADETIILLIEVGASQHKPVDVGDIEFEDSTPFKAEVTGTSGVLYASSAPGNPPGPGATVSLSSGTPYNTTVGALKTALGISESLPLLMVQNNGPVTGTYRFTFGA